MTPERQVIFFERQDGGAMLRLDCGHWVWAAGMDARPETHACGQSPCYRPERAMGAGTGIFGGAR